MGPDVAQQEFVPKLSLHLSFAGSVDFHLSVADVDAVGHLHDVFDDTLDALPFKVVVEPLMDLFFTKVPVEVRFFHSEIQAAHPSMCCSVATVTQCKKSTQASWRVPR